MAGMFCSIQEAAEALGKTEDELRDLISQGKLREFRDGPNLLLKMNEIEAIAAEEGIELAAVREGTSAPAPLPSIPNADQLAAQADLPDVADLELPDIDDSDLEPLDDDIPELEALESEAEIDLPDAPVDESADIDLAALDSLGVDEVPAMEAAPPVKSKPKKDKKTKKERKQKPKKQPKPKPMKAIANSAPRQSFGQWLVGGLRDDNLLAIIVFILLIAVVLAALVAAGYGVHLAFAKLL
ncbi:MAG: helix-turn-helix domain-containing protein [Sedimentisphaerales bacterium]|nr:helix-turn-helix domain-containing protein [Sedimentisphaerales bacterium]